MSLIRINTHPSRRQLLVFGAAWLVFVGVVGVVLWAKDRSTAAVVAGSLALVVPAAGLAWPEGLRLLYVGLSYATYPIGLTVSSLVLVAIYYLVLTPIGLILRVCRYDPLHRRREPGAATYWQKRPEPRGAETYFRQH